MLKNFGLQDFGFKVDEKTENKKKEKKGTKEGVGLLNQWKSTKTNVGREGKNRRG